MSELQRQIINIIYKETGTDLYAATEAGKKITSLVLQTIEENLPKKRDWRKQKAENGLMWNAGYNDSLAQIKTSLIQAFGGGDEK